MLTESQIRARIRTQMRTALLTSDVAKLREQREKEAVEKIASNLKALAAALDSEVENLESMTFEEFENDQTIEESVDHNRLNESMLVTLYGAVISASGIAKILGYMAKGIAKVLNRLGLDNIDPEKEGKTFFEISEYIHHLYLGALKKLAAKMGIPENKRSLAANVMFGVLLGAAMSFTGMELYSAIKGGKLALSLGEGGMAGIKIGEGAETGANIWTLVQEAFSSVPELASTIVDTAETTEEVLDAIDAVANMSSAS